MKRVSKIICAKYIFMLSIQSVIFINGKLFCITNDTLIVDNFSTQRTTMLQLKWIIDTTSTYDTIEIQRRNLPDTTWNHLIFLPSICSSYLDTSVIRNQTYQYKCKVHTQNGWVRLFISNSIVVGEPCVLDILEYLLPPNNVSIQFRLYTGEVRHGTITYNDSSDAIIKFLGTIDTSSFERIHFIREVVMSVGYTNDTTIIQLKEKKDSLHTFSFSQSHFWARHWQYCRYLDNPAGPQLSIGTRFNRVSFALAHSPPQSFDLLSFDLFMDGRISFKRDFGIVGDGFGNDVGPVFWVVKSMLQSVTEVQQIKPKKDNISITNFPNPFSTTTTISFSIPTQQHVTLKIFNLLGKKITTLIDDILDAGQHSIKFDPRTSQFAIHNGIYFYRLIAGNNSTIKKMIVTH